MFFWLRIVVHFHSPFYRNSQNSLGVTDAFMTFAYLSITDPGRNHDTSVWQENQNLFLISFNKTLVDSLVCSRNIYG